MKVQRVSEALRCDFCPETKDYGIHKCYHCGKDACRACSKEQKSSVYYESDRDPSFCSLCIAELSIASPGTNQVWDACQAILRLHDEYREWLREFDKRQKEAVARCEEAIALAKRSFN